MVRAAARFSPITAQTTGGLDGATPLDRGFNARPQERFGHLMWKQVTSVGTPASKRFPHLATTGARMPGRKRGSEFRAERAVREEHEKEYAAVAVLFNSDDTHGQSW